MERILLLFNFILPSVFFVLGKRRGEKELMAESVLFFLAAVLFSPVVCIYFSLTAQAVFSAFLMLLEYFSLAAIVYRSERI